MMSDLQIALRRGRLCALALRRRLGPHLHPMKMHGQRNEYWMWRLGQGNDLMHGETTEWRSGRH